MEQYNDNNMLMMKKDQIRGNTIEAKHCNKCLDMFEEALKAEKIYVHIDEINEEYNGIRFSIVTREMQDYDSGMAEIKGYRPYFFSYVAEFKGDIKKYVEEKSVSEQGLPEEDRCFVATFNPNHVKPLFKLEGIVEYAVNSIQYQKRSLIIIDKAYDIFVHNFPISINAVSDHVVKKSFNNTFGNVIFKNAYIYKAGHANLIRITGHTGKRHFKLLYDIGCHWGNPNSALKMYSKANTALRSMKPSAVILSHWDADHIMGVVYLPNIAFDCQWFAPAIEEHRQNAIRLAKYLIFKKKLVLVRRDVADRTIAVINVTKKRSQCIFGLYMGKNIRIDKISKANSSGLVLTYEYRDANQTVVKSAFCGDVPYKAICNQIWNKKQIYNYLLIPHHARKMTVLNNVKGNSTNSVALYCKDKIGDKNHIRELFKQGFTQILKTESVPKLYYKIDLRTPGACFKH